MLCRLMPSMTTRAVGGSAGAALLEAVPFGRHSRMSKPIYASDSAQQAPLGRRARSAPPIAARPARSRLDPAFDRRSESVSVVLARKLDGSWRICYNRPLGVLSDFTLITDKPGILLAVHEAGHQRLPRRLARRGKARPGSP